jgi:putative ABC transport system substrate-binding protein
MRRRDFVAFLCSSLAAPLARAQRAGRVWRVAIVLTTSPLAEMAGSDPAHPLTRAILHELNALGYVEGRNLAFERRSAEGDPQRYRPIVQELVALGCDAIILSGNHDLVRAAHAATRTIPLILMSYATAVQDGFAKSLARPGGNITGRSDLPMLDIAGKALQLLKEAIPSLTRVALLRAADTPAALLGPAQNAGKALRIEVVPIEHHPTDPRISFAEIAKARVGGVLVMPSSIAYAQREALGALALEARVPAMVPFPRIVETGGLMSYAPNPVKEIRSIAHYVDKILKGANPGDLPMENARVFELTINLRTARTLGLSVSQSLLVRADRVIE